ncbi:Outer membrane protein OmpA [Hymenobacter arizonensis]|uniref:Outer membrane protein OmpA n=2 Tax=Hymenobacter arizonensis TaxID=1227077 RepID=A0A1I5VEI8_HYMAR|nr:Outer membrane protein OmpA [Hymenobacter arizonensis]
MGAGYFLARSFIGQTQTADNPLAADQAPGPDNATGPNTPNKATAPAGKLTARGASRTSALASAAGSYDASRDVFIYNTGPETVITLPDGTRLLAGANSTERRLYRLLGSASLLDTIGPSRRWIVLDRIGFEPGTATLLPESAEQLGNLARLLKAFPRAQLLIGSYTDSTGRMVFNYQISAERARATMQALTRMGVPAARLQTRGYGPQSFLVPNTTPTNRALNRRTSIRVLNK